MDFPLVSIIIPSYNHAQYIENAIESVLNQTYQNIELIINDDGSNDNTHEVLKKYIGTTRVTIKLNQKNRNQATVLNEAIDMAKGDFIGFLPSDDWYLPNKIELQIKKFESVSAEVGVIYGAGLFYLQESGEMLPTGLKLFKGNILEEMLKGPFNVFPVTPLFRKNCFSMVKFDETYSAEGEGLYVRLAKYVKFDYVDEVIGVMRAHTYNIGANIDKMCSDNLRWWPDFFKAQDLPENLRKYKPVVMGRLKRMYGLEYIIRANNFRKGCFLLIQAIYEQPAYILDYKVLVGVLSALFPSQISIFLVNFYKKWK